MLVIRCREGESVSIGDDVEVTVLAVGPGKVKLGFKAPAAVAVARQCTEFTRHQNQAAVIDTDQSLLSALIPYLGRAEPNSMAYIVPLQDSKKIVPKDSTLRDDR